jgi:hypothetical protein
MNLVPWFPEIALLGGALALIPGLLRMRQASRRPVLATYTEPVLISLVVLVVLDGLISARTGASFALGALAALTIQWLADFGIERMALGLSAWGTALLGLGLVFELFGRAAGMDDGGWKLFAQLVAAFALGSALITATRRSDDMAIESADAGIFAAAAALVIAAATPFAANRVDGVALPMLIAAAGLATGVFGFVWKGSRSIGLMLGALLGGVLIAVVATGLDPVALSLRESPVTPQAPLIAGLAGVALGVAIRLIDRRKWTIVLVVAALLACYPLGPLGTAVGALSAFVAVALPSAPCQAVTVLAAVAIVVASHTGSPLVTPSHWSGWFHTFVAAAVVGVIGGLGKGPRLALLRVTLLTWVVIGPLLL